MFDLLTDEQRAMQQTIRKFAEQEVAPKAQEMDETGEYPYELMARCHELGLTSLLIPEADGGLGLGVTEFCIAIEEIAKASQTLAITLDASVTLCFLPILSSGTEAQKKNTCQNFCMVRLVQ